MEANVQYDMAILTSTQRAIGDVDANLYKARPGRAAGRAARRQQ